MNTKIYTQPTRSRAHRELKHQLCRTDRTIIHSCCFYDEIDEKHKVVIHYYE